MNRRHRALLLTAVMLAVGLAEPASGHHKVPDPFQELSQPPFSLQWPDPDANGVQPVQRRLDQVGEGVDGANRSFGDAYRVVVGESLNKIDTTTREARQPITLLRDGAGGPHTQSPPDLLDGGFGLPDSFGTHTWGYSESAAQRGELGYHSPRNPDGTYPAFASSLLVTPVIDLGTNIAQERRVENGVRLGIEAVQQTDPAEPVDQTYRQAGDEACQALGSPCIVPTPPQRPAIPSGVAVPVIPDVVSTVYALTYWSCDLSYFGLAVPDTALMQLGLSPLLTSNVYPLLQPECLAFRDLFSQQETHAILDYSVRHNLADGRDGVTAMVFTQPPTLELAQQCLPTVSDVRNGPVTPTAPPYGRISDVPCRVVIPTSGAYKHPNQQALAGNEHPVPPGGTQQLASQPGRMGYTGASEWIQDSIDLTPWSGMSSVWVGFFFGSGVVGGPSYFLDPELFDAEAGFYGFELDNLVLRARAAPVNVGIHSITSPSCGVQYCRPEVGAPPTLFVNPGEAVPITVRVSNPATRMANVTLVVRILHDGGDGGARPVAWRSQDIHALMPPGGTLEAHLVGPSTLPLARYVMQACLARIGDTRDEPLDNGDAYFCNGPVQQGRCSLDALEADPCSRVLERKFRIASVFPVTVQEPVVATRALGSGDTMQATMTFTNAGDRDERLQVKLAPIDLATGNIDQGLLPLEQRQARMVTVPARGQVVATWDLAGSDPGTYRLLAQVNNSLAEPRPFAPKYDLLPGLLQPWRPVAARSNLLIDGIEGRGEDWARAPLLAMPGGLAGARMQAVNNDTHLTLLVSNLPSSAPDLTLFFNDFDDGTLGTPGDGFGLMLNSTHATVIRANPQATAWDALQTWEFGNAPGYPAAQARYQTNPVTKLRQWEISIPINAADAAGLKARPGDALGILMRHCASHEGNAIGQQGLVEAQSDLPGYLGLRALPRVPIPIESYNEVNRSVGAIPSKEVQQAGNETGRTINTVNNHTFVKGQNGTSNMEQLLVPEGTVSLLLNVSTTGDPINVTIIPANCPKNDCNQTFPLDDNSTELSFTQPRSGTWRIRLSINGTLGLFEANYNIRSVLQRSVTVSSPCAVFPQAAPLRDGDGLFPRDGDLSPELGQWHPIVLAATEDDAQADQEPFAVNLLGTPFSVGLGVDPPFFQEDFQSCTTLESWTLSTPATSILDLPGNMSAVKWNCAPFTEDSGRSLLYWGASPGSTCNGLPCLPHAGIPQQPARPYEPYKLAHTTPPRENRPPAPPGDMAMSKELFDNLFHHENETFIAWSAPIEVPGSAREPIIVLAHQYSTQAVVEDASYVSAIDIRHKLNARVEVWDDDSGAWVVYAPPLVPEGGFPDENSTGIRDDRYPTRRYYDPRGGCLTQPRERQSEKDPAMPPTWLVKGCKFEDTGGGWWWPQGMQATYRPLESDVPVPGEFQFHGGSPWTVDRLALHGLPDLDLRGQTIRLRFSALSQSHADRSPQVDLEDWGWRIAELAVMERQPLLRDIAVESARLQVGFDPARTGIAPNTPVPVQVTIRNEGLLAAQGVKVLVKGHDLTQGVERCATTKDLQDIILPGEERNVTVSCPIGAAPGKVSFAVQAEMLHDAFEGNNLGRVRGAFAIQPSKAVEVVSLDATPQSGAVGQERDISVFLRNTGNVPLEGVMVALKASLVGTGAPQQKWQAQWTATQPLGLSPEPTALTDLLALADAPAFVPDKPGIYLIEVAVTVPGAAAEEVQRRTIQLEANDEILRLDFDRPAAMDPSVLHGEPIGTRTGWGVTRVNGIGGSAHLLAGNASSGEIAPGSDASYVLPAIDLALMEDATLTFRHRYDLEEGYDAGRPEISFDGGATWTPLQPRAQGANGLDEGYPSLRIIGANPILGDDVECHACAYTGTSEALPGNEQGWVGAEFDLTRQSHLFATEPIERWSIDGRSPLPSIPRDRGSGPEFTHDTWVLDPRNPATETKNQRYWWIDNRTYSEPSSPFGSRMWWSGTAGEKDPDTGKWRPVDTTLRFEAKPQTLANGESLILSFWDWRDGWEDSANGDRLGTGGKYGLGIDGLPATPGKVVERLPSGWTRREVNLTSVHERPLAGFNFTFQSGLDKNAPQVGGLDASTVQANQGWFIGQVSLFKRTPAGDSEIFSNKGSPSGATVLHHAKQGPAWSLVRRGEAASDGGWHLQEATVPGKGTASTWRFASDDVHGYPNRADSRLVTPLLDLRGYRGDSVSLTFDHRYGFHGDVSASDGIGHALDGGTVEYQVMDSVTGSFGPWQVLPVDQAAREMAFVAKNGGWLQVENPVDTPKQAALGYPGLMFSPAPTDFGGRTDVRYVGLGAGLPLTDGWIREPEGTLATPQPGVLGRPFLPYPFTPVFTGTSNGWMEQTMNLTPFIGQQVRFAFHALTTPSEAPGCLPKGATANFTVNQERMAWFGSQDARDCIGLHGWSIANVQIEGQQFKGQSALVRFRVATDGSMPKGSWSIDDIRITGQRHAGGVVFSSNQTTLRALPGEPVAFETVVRNLGARTGQLALGVDARAGDGSSKNPELVQVFQPRGAENVEVDLLPFGIERAFHLGSLAPAGRDGDRLPVRIGWPELPTGQLDLRLTVLELEESCSAGEDAQVCTVRYVPLRNSRAAGLPVITFRATGSSVVDVQLAPPRTDTPARLVADPPISMQTGGEWQTLTLRASVHNNGTRLPSNLGASWSVTEILSKGSTAKQVGTNPQDGRTWSFPRQGLEDLALGESRPLSVEFTPPGPGLYKASLQVRSGSTLLQQHHLEFLAGAPRPYYAIDFGHAQAANSGWSAAALAGADAYGASPASLAFRHDGERFIWGITEQEYSAGKDYCTGNEAACNPGVATTRPADPVETVYGLHGIASGPSDVALNRVIGSRAVLTLRSGHLFGARDGAVVEATPVFPLSNPRALPQPVFTCQNANGDVSPLWFQLTPVSPSESVVHESGHPALRIRDGTKDGPGGTQSPTFGFTPHRVNPVDLNGNGPLIGGVGIESSVVRFALDNLTTSCPPGFARPTQAPALPPTLVNYTLQLRLRTGTTPGLDIVKCDGSSTNDCIEPCTDFAENDCRGEGETDRRARRRGALGWQVDSIAISSVDVQLGPQERRVVQILDGFTKRFNVQVTNLAPFPETYTLGLADDASLGSVEPDWVSFPVPEVHLRPGETRTVPFEVHIPAGTTEATYTLYAQATSRLDPNTFSRIRVALELPESLLPDLWTGIDIQSDNLNPEPGRFLRVATTVHNLGRRAVDSVPLRLQAVRIGDGGAETATLPIATTQVPRLEPDEATVSIVQWAPPQEGLYRIEALTDPAGKLVEASVANNLALALIHVLPPERPQVRVMSLAFSGADSEGYVLEGNWVVINATLRNDGAAVATGGRLILTAGTTELADVLLPPLSPGESRSVTAVAVGSPGETKVRATYIPGSGLDDQHQLTRILRVRGLDLAFAKPTQALELVPGGIASLQMNVSNAGNAVEKVAFELDPAHKGWGLAATPNPIRVAPNNGSAWSILTFTAPSDALGGRYNLTLRALAQSDPASIREIRIPVHVAAASGPMALRAANATLAPGQVDLMLSLQSTSNVPQAITVRTSPEWSQGFQRTIPARAAATVPLPVDVPDHTPPGRHPLRIRVLDASGALLAEADSNITVLPKAAASASWGQASDRLEEDLLSRVLAIEILFRNDGNVPVRPSVALTGLSEGVQAVSLANASHVKPGETARLPVAVRVNHEFAERVTGQAHVFMEASQNGSKRVFVTALELPDLARLPDLTIKEVGMPRGSDAGKPVHGHVRVANLGATTAPATDLYAYLNGEAISVHAIRALEPGEGMQVNISWEFPRAGDFVLHFAVDGRGKVPELHDDNNGWSQGITVGSGGFLHEAKREAPDIPAVALPPLVILLALCLAWMRRRMA